MPPNRRRPPGKWNPWPAAGCLLALAPWVVLFLALKACKP